LPRGYPRSVTGAEFIRSQRGERRGPRRTDTVSGAPTRSGGLQVVETISAGCGPGRRRPGNVECQPEERDWSTKRVSHPAL